LKPHQKTFSASPTYCHGQLLATFTVKVFCDRTVFKTWLKTCLIPTLKPGQIMIADNAIFHKGGRIFQLIEAAGCQLKYLPFNIVASI
jgi:DDE superfamily endonuclease